MGTVVLIRPEQTFYEGISIVGQGDDEPLKAPVIEFRDLGSKKPSEMKAVFEEIITKVED